jgi:Fe-S cluster assembly ATP-binding protein
VADTPTFRIEDLRVSVDQKEILKGVNLEVSKGEVHALMGPNGSGKSTLANALMGHPRYVVTSGRIYYKGEDITALPVDLRAKKGMFLAFQYPLEIPGVKVRQFLRMALKSVRGTDVKVSEFRKLLTEKMQQLEVNPAFAERYLNEGFSGGEKKRNEVLQMAILQPELAIMDETDSGLDIDALKIVSDGINALRGPDLGILLITHYQRMLNYVTPDFVHVLVDGRIVRSGGKELALELEERGYDQFQEKVLEAVS